MHASHHETPSVRASDEAEDFNYWPLALSGWLSFAAVAALLYWLFRVA